MRKQDQDTHLTRLEAKEIASEAAGLAISQAFFMLGIDVSDAKQINEFRDIVKDAAEQKAARKKAGELMQTTIWKVVPIITVGFLGWMGLVFSDGLRLALGKFLAGS